MRHRPHGIVIGTDQRFKDQVVLIGLGSILCFSSSTRFLRNPLRFTYHTVSYRIVPYCWCWCPQTLGPIRTTALEVRPKRTHQNQTSHRTCHICSHSCHLIAPPPDHFATILLLNEQKTRIEFLAVALLVTIFVLEHNEPQIELKRFSSLALAK